MSKFVPVPGEESINYEGLQDLGTKIKDLQDKLKEVKDFKSEVYEKLSDTKTKIIESLGIFVAFFTFVSVQFQIFDRAENLSNSFLTGLTLILLGGLTTFICLLDQVLNDHKEEKRLRKTRSGRILLIAIFIVLIGVLLSCTKELKDWLIEWTTLIIEN